MCQAWPFLVQLIGMWTKQAVEHTRHAQEIIFYK